MSGVQAFNLRSQLSQSLKRRIDKLGVTIEQDCKGKTERLICQCVERLVAARVVDRPDKLIQAERALGELIDCMCEHARSIGSFPLLCERAFEKAKTELCPCWPLC